MFDNLELPSNLSQYLVSITPILGISGSIENSALHVLTKYIPLPNNQILVCFQNNNIPNELTLNVLRKGEDRVLLSAYSSTALLGKSLKKSNKIGAPFYLHSAVSFELKIAKELDYESDEKLAVYDIVHAYGVAGLDPAFNDEVTIAKTIEVMALTAVDNLVIKRKL